jgi:hypothetical protein
VGAQAGFAIRFFKEKVIKFESGEYSQLAVWQNISYSLIQLDTTFPLL